MSTGERSFEFYRVAFRKKIYRSLEELQFDLDEWLKDYNEERTHQGKICDGRTLMQTLFDGKQAAIEKMIPQNSLDLSDRLSRVTRLSDHIPPTTP